MIVVHCLGTFSLTIGGTEIRHWRAGKARSLFVYLLLRRGQCVSRERLQEALWPDADAEAQSRSLRVAVHGLRRALAPAALGARGRGSPLSLRSHETGYALHASGVWIDFEELEQSVQAARALEARGETARALALYRRASDLYRGDFLADESATWIYEEREWLRDLLLQALAPAARAAVDADDPLAAVRWCRRMLEIEPCGEETYRLLMLCHARLGQLSRVKRWYELCALRLRRELDTAPDEATDLLLARALRGELARDPGRGGDPGIVARPTG